MSNRNDVNDDPAQHKRESKEVKEPIDATTVADPYCNSAKPAIADSGVEEEDITKIIDMGLKWIEEQPDPSEWFNSRYRASRNRVDPTHIDWGFDLTSFGQGKSGADRFIRILDQLAISHTPQSIRYPPMWTSSKSSVIQSSMSGAPFVWTSKNITIITHNNPITGMYSGGLQRRKPELGYASYMGLHGSRDLVQQAVTLIKNLASHIKDESPLRREFL